MFASLLKKKNKAPYFIAHRISCFESMLRKMLKTERKQKKVLFKKVSKKYRKGEALNLISQTGVVAHTYNPYAAGGGGRAIRSSRSSSITKLVQG